MASAVAVPLAGSESKFQEGSVPPLVQGILNGGSDPEADLEAATDNLVKEGDNVIFDVNEERQAFIIVKKNG